jgi:[ribosomal protein S5]-alanine N-acetyltransferase
MIFETARLYVRQFTPNDADSFYALNGDEEVVRYIRAPKTREESDAFLQETIENYNNPSTSLRFAIILKEDGQLIGTFAVIPLENTTELQMGYAFLKKYWAQGYATEIVTAGLHYVFNALQLQKIVAVTEVANISSQKVLLKNGFIPVKNYLEKNKEVILFQKEPGTYN